MVLCVSINYATISKFAPRFPSIMNHTWSLAVEEQFYLIWPLLVYLFSKRHIFYLSSGLILISIITRIYFSYHSQNAFLVFTTLPSVMDSLAIGAMLAILARSGMSHESLGRTGKYLMMLSFPVLLGLVWFCGYENYWNPNNYLSKHFGNLLFFTFSAFFFAAAIAFTVFNDNIFSGIMRLKPLKHIGKISYGLYMYHWPTIYFTRFLFKKPDLFPGVTMILTTLAVTYLAALCSWHLVEKRFLALKDKYAAMDYSLPVTEEDKLKREDKKIIQTNQNVEGI
jgi:peptidoglycan/LPS O-acetylase OafA/YrhL